MSYAKRALGLVKELQGLVVACAHDVAEASGDSETLEEFRWQRDGGTHGGGSRYVAVLTPTWNRVAVNVSHVHYDDLPAKKLASATALSTILHPQNPHAPSMHMHISWTAMKSGRGGWRIMADLNPAIAYDEDRDAFRDVLRRAAGASFEEGSAQGDKYFAIPALDRHRGVAHFYLEGYSSGDLEADFAVAKRVGEDIAACYRDIVKKRIAANPSPTNDDRRAQLAYHSAYLLQVLTLDRGTTSGILIHDQNDVGILGSLPSFADKGLLSSWVERLPAPQDALLGEIASALSDESPSPVTNEHRAKLAAIVRSHYRAHPEALSLQASGNTIPTTVDNHD